MWMLRFGIFGGVVIWLALLLDMYQQDETLDPSYLLAPALTVVCYVLYVGVITFNRGPTLWQETIAVGLVCLPLLVVGLPLIVGGGVWGGVRGLRKLRRGTHGNVS
jgi:hypothetical protein